MLITATNKASSLSLVVVLLFKLCCLNRFICVLLFVLVFLLVKLAEVSLLHHISSRCVSVSNPGVPGPTSKLSPRAPAQMGRRETEREGGKKPEGDRRER
jgi:hypothetical protein